MRYFFVAYGGWSPALTVERGSWGSSGSVGKRGVFTLSGAKSSAGAAGVRTDFRRPSDGLALLLNEKPWRLNTDTTFLEGCLTCYRLASRFRQKPTTFVIAFSIVGMMETVARLTPGKRTVWQRT